MEEKLSSHELIELWLAAADEQAEGQSISDEQREALNRLIEEDAEVRQRLIAFSQQLAWLMWYGSTRSGSIDVNNVDAVVARINGLIENADSAASQETSRRASLYTFLGDFTEQSGVLFRPPMVFFTLLAAVFLSAFVAYQIPRGEQQLIAANLPVEQRQRSLPYAATLVNVTNCRWDESRSTADIRGGSRLQPGQSLCLLEGIAEINSTLARGGVGRFQLEGPAAMSLTSEGMPSLQYGRLAAQITSDFDQFSLDTPLGRVTVNYDSSIGVVSTTNEFELHVFEGWATFEPAWPVGGYSAEQLKVVAGNSLRILTSGETGLEVHRASADVKRFASLTSMATSQLNLSDAYVSAVRAAKPVGYWRFESDVGGVIRNEMADRFHLRIHGDGIRWRMNGENRSAEFGATSELCCLMSNETLDEFSGKNCAIEVWVKPSHYHHATVFGLVNWASTDSFIAEHCMLIELCGSPRGHTVKRPLPWDRHPGQIRFLYRSPAGFTGGESCFSPEVYALRKWQHIVATKAGSALRLYIDGRLAAKGMGSTEVAPGMHILIGQLFPPGPGQPLPMRSFVGELDEVALYDRSLSEREVERHYQLAQSKSNAKAKSKKKAQPGPEV